MEKIEYKDRRTGKIIIETPPGERWLKFLYYNPFGELALHSVVKRKILTEVYGRKMNSASSKEKIKPFVLENNIDMNESKKQIDEFISFNDFFIRELKEGARAIDKNENTIVSPADGKILVFEDLTKIENFFVKGDRFTLKEFFKNDELAKKYEGGVMVIVRLAPTDYHRFHFPASGKIFENVKIEGYYYSVSPYAIRKNFRVFCENKREYSILKTKNFGDIALVEIAATMVGGMNQSFRPNSYVEKGEEKGYFYFGGSTCIMFLEKNMVKFDEDILENSRKCIETKIFMGEKIGEKK